MRSIHVQDRLFFKNMFDCSLAKSTGMEPTDTEDLLQLLLLRLGNLSNRENLVLEPHTRRNQYHNPSTS
jgi:hypothetical protein